MNVAMTCETQIIDPPDNPKDIKRSNLSCKITYVSQSKNYMNKIKIMKQEIGILNLL